MREAVRASRAHGLTRLDSPESVNRLDDIARTTDAIRKRARRIGVYSYGPALSLGK